MRKKKRKKSLFWKRISSSKSFFLSKVAYVLPFLMLAVFVFLLDQLSKYYVHNYIPRMFHETQWYPYNGIGVFPNFFGIEFSIVHAINKGAAWGIFADFQDYILFFRIAFVFCFFIYMLFYNDNRLLLPPFILILIGAIGNIFDYFIYGHVVDMFHVVLWGWDYPVFNVADSAIFIGICYVFVVSWTLQKKPKKSRS